MRQPRDLTVRFPIGGLHKRHGFQSQPDYTTPDCQNVWPDDVTTGRDRGGRRPGLTKAISTELPNAIRMLAVVNLNAESGFTEQLVCSAGGQLYRHNASAGTWSLVSTALRIATDRLVLATPHEQKLYIADWGIATSGTTMKTAASTTVVYENLTGDTDGATPGSGGVTFTDGDATFETDGVEPGTHILRVTSTGSGGHAVVGVYEIVSVDSETQLTLAATADDGTAETGVSYEVNVSQENAGVNADDFRMLILAAGNGTEGQYEISSVADDRITVGSTVGGSSITGIHYQVHRAPKVWDLLDDSVTLLTASAGTAPLGCNIVTTHNNRIFWAGDPNDPNNFYASEAGDGTDYNYGQEFATSAVRGNEYRGGQIGDPITALIPHNEDCLLVGTNDNFYVIRGDIADGGYIIRISSAVGPITPSAWCRTDTDELVMLTRDGIYSMAPGCGSTPMQISRKTLPIALLNVGEDHNIHMGFDHLMGAVHIYIVLKTVVWSETSGGISFGTVIEEDGITVNSIPISSDFDATWLLASSYRIDTVTTDKAILADIYPSAPISNAIIQWSRPEVQAYWIDWRRAMPDGGRPVWPMKLADEVGAPTAIIEYRPFATQKMSPLIIGTDEGLTCSFDRQQVDDNGTDFESFVVIGPIRISPSSDRESMVVDCRSTSGLLLDSYDYTIYAGKTAETSRPNAANMEGSWASETFNASDYREFVNIAGHAATIKVEDQSTIAAWSFEELVLTIHQRDLIR